MRRSKSRSSSLVFPSTNSADFSSQRCVVYTDKHVPIPLLKTAPFSSCPRNLAGTAIRPFASIVCSYSPRNMSIRAFYCAHGPVAPCLVCTQDVLPHPERASVSEYTLALRTAWPHPQVEFSTFREISPQPPTSPHQIITLFYGLREGCYPPIFFS